MSGLKNEPVTGGKFLNFKDGAIISANDGEKKAYTHLEGMVIDLDIVDENYKGKDYRKIVLFVKDDEQNIWKLGFPLESGYGNAFCSLSPNIDFTIPLKISGGIKEMDNEKSYGVLFVKQPTGSGAEGESTWKNIKWFYTKESKDIPGGERKKDRTGEYMDYSARNDFFHRLLIETIRPTILEAVELLASPGKDFRKETATAEKTKADKKKVK